MIKVCSFDPGGTTGYTFNEIIDGMLFINAAQNKWNEEHLWEFLDDRQPDIIVYEGFNYRNRARAGLDLTPVNLIGVINLWGQQHKDVVLKEQPPGTGFAYFTNRRLKEEGVFQPGKPHAMDALRHLLHWWQFGAGYKYNTKGFNADER